jgi:two-component system phosphate regulon response regulator PhoB
MFYTYVHMPTGALTSDQDVITKGRMSIHIEDRLVLWNGRPIKALAPVELKILRLLVLESPKIVDRNKLALNVWETRYEDLHPHTIYEHVRRLRNKLGPASVCFKTVRDLGLQWLDKAMFPAAEIVP